MHCLKEYRISQFDWEPFIHDKFFHILAMFQEWTNGDWYYIEIHRELCTSIYSIKSNKFYQIQGEKNPFFRLFLRQYGSYVIPLFCFLIINSIIEISIHVRKLF